ncbi:GIN domain-containing protein [Chloroflexota bacterium]
MILGCGLHERTTVGSGILETKGVDLSGFTKLDVGHAFIVEIIEGDSYGVTIKADDNLVEFLNVETLRDTLKLGLKSNRTYIGTTQKATVITPVLQEIKLSGAAKANIRGFSSIGSVKFDLSGGSEVLLSGLEAANIELNITGGSHVAGNLEMQDGKFNLSGGSDTDLTGSGVKASIVATSGSELNLEDLTLFEATVTLSGASIATVNARGKLDADLSDSSELYYIGSPALGKVKSSGGSIISHKTDSPINK